MLESLLIDDFSGGKTDYYVGGPLNKFREGDNILIIKHDSNRGKLYSRPGSEIWDDVNYQIPAGEQRIGLLKLFKDSPLLVSSANDVSYVDAGAWVTLQGPTGNDVFPSSVTVANVVNTAYWNNHLFLVADNLKKPQKIFKNGSGVLQVRTAGLPPLASDPVVTPTGVGQSFIYAFLFQVAYQVESLTLENRGPVTQVLVENSGDPSVNQNNITAIPVLANGATDNYDTTNIKVEIYRTTNGGDVLFLLDTVSNGTTTYTDTTSDANLQLEAVIYTDGDVVENDPPPLCRTMCIVQKYAYYGAIQEGSDIFENKIQQSLQDYPDGAPIDFFTLLDDSIMQLSGCKEIPLALCTNYIYRLEGAFDELGRGGLFPVRISATAGCVSRQSAVETELGTFWFGKDGVYFTDGYQVQKVNKSLDKTSSTYITTVNKATAPLKVQGKYDSKNRRVYWTVWENSGSGDVDKLFILDLNYGISDDMPFTTNSGGSSFAPTSVEFQDKIYFRADKRGYIFRHDPEIFNDPKVDTNLTPDNWSVQPILYDYISCATSLGVDHIRKYAPRVSANVANETNVSLQITSINDDGRRTEDLAPIRYRNNLIWGDEDAYWEDGQIIWDQGGLLDADRNVPNKSLYFTFKQIQLSNAMVAILNSDLIGLATMNQTTPSFREVTLVDAASFDWPSKSVDYYIAFSNDDYTNEFLVTERTNDVLTIADPTGVGIDGTYEWVLRGIPKDETLNLVSYTIHHLPISDTQQKFYKSQTGEVGSSNLA